MGFILGVAVGLYISHRYHTEIVNIISALKGMAGE